MAKHAKFSASGSNQWLNCPGVIGMRSLCPKPRQSEAAALGTAAHELVELCMKENLDANEMIDREIKIEEKTEDGSTILKSYTVDDNMADAVQVCLDVARSYMSAYPHADIMLEQKVDVSPLVAPDMFGTVDIRIAVPYDKLIIIDYKHGSGVPVDVEDNTQLIYYALGSALEDDFEFDTVEMVIVQPRCPHADGSVRSYEISIDELKEWIKVFKKGVQKAQEAEKAIVEAGEPIEEYVKAGSWCKFCPAAAVTTSSGNVSFCPARHKQMIETALLDFEEDDEGETRMALSKKPNQLTDDQLLTVLQDGQMVKDFIDEVFSYAQKRLEAGHSVPKHKLVNKRAYTKFKDDEKVVIEKLVTMGFEEDIITRTKLETLTKLRKECGKEVINDLTYIPDSGVTIAHESDKRPAVEPSATADFEDGTGDDQY
jgi:hypothetical protein